MSADARRVDETMPDEDLANSLLAAFGGDAVMALRSVIADAEFLYNELHTASFFLSSGIARGWQPRLRREQ